MRIGKEDIARLLKPRDPYAHKGSMGYALIIAGKRGMCGAAILAARACLRSGVGKVAVQAARKNIDIMQISVPEAILNIDAHDEYFSQPVDPSIYNAIGIGPGIGTEQETALALKNQLEICNKPILLDADALNILGTHKEWQKLIPEGSILTPHAKEMDRLAGNENIQPDERLANAIRLAQELKVYIILKGHESKICLPDGNVLVNTTGNAGMATAGSGDVLSGIIIALLARGYSSKEAAMMGMYLHGLAGDLAAANLGMESLIASDIISYLPKAFKELESAIVE